MECEGSKKHLKTLHFIPFLINQDFFQGFLSFSPDDTAGFFFFFFVCRVFSRFSTLKITYYFYILEKKHTCTSGEKK